MSMLMSLICRSVCIALLTIGFAINCFSAGQAERKHEERAYVSNSEHYEHILSLDDVFPSSKSLFIRASSEDDKALPDPIVIRVTGYSAFDSEKDVKSEAKRLLALRASKIDAYRALAERVYGLSISGKSLVKNFELKEDSFAIGFDSFIRGARVVSVNEKKGIGFETVMELVLPGNFDDCLNKVNNFKNGLNCLRPLPAASYLLEEEKMSTQSKSKSKGSVKQYQGSRYFLN